MLWFACKLGAVQEVKYEMFESICGVYTVNGAMNGEWKKNHSQPPRNRARGRRQSQITLSGGKEQSKHSKMWKSFHIHTEHFVIISFVWTGYAASLCCMKVVIAGAPPHSHLYQFSNLLSMRTLFAYLNSILIGN